MKGKKIFDAITEVKDEYIEEARTNKLQKSCFKWKRWIALAACLVIVIGIGGAYLKIFPVGGNSGNTGSGGAGKDEGNIFMSYAGPVFPLKLAEDDNEIIASRNINFDFSLVHEDNLRVWGSSVKDRYTLENISNEDKRIKIRYPFVASFSDLEKLIPTINIDNVEIRPKIYSGGYTGGFFGAGGRDDEDGSVNILHLHNWEGYKQLLESGNYEKNAFMTYPQLNQNVKVYKFTDFQAPEEYDAATQAISFNINLDKTIILTYGFNGGEFREDGFRRFSYFVPNKVHSENDEKYLIVIGDDIGQYDLQGYKTGGCEKGNELEGVSSKITKEDEVLSSVMEKIIGSFLYEFGDEERAKIHREMFLGSVFEFMTKYSLISPSKIQRYDLGMLEDIISDASSIKRVFYLEFEADIQANESIIVLAYMHKNPSYDFHCSNSNNVGIQSYDMVTKLGSNLSLKSLSAELSSTDEIEIVNQNFGFDLSNGITNVELDLDTEHYYLDIKTRK